MCTREVNMFQLSPCWRPFPGYLYSGIVKMSTSLEKRFIEVDIYLIYFFICSNLNLAVTYQSCHLGNEEIINTSK